MKTNTGTIGKQLNSFSLRQAKQSAALLDMLLEGVAIRGAIPAGFYTKKAA